MKVAIYARVSTDDKDQNPERQILACRNYCDTNNHKVLGEFKDYITGDSPPILRDGFTQMMKLKPQGIVIFSIDRLSRQHPSKIMAFLEQYRQANILIISVTEPIFNMESPFVEPLQYILTWWNNYFLQKLRVDIKSGMEKARAQGKQIGRPKLKFNEFRAYKLLFEENKTLTEAMHELNVSRSSLHRFKKVVEKNPELYKRKGVIPERDGFET